MVAATTILILTLMKRATRIRTIFVVGAIKHMSTRSQKFLIVRALLLLTSFGCNVGHEQIAWSQLSRMSIAAVSPNGLMYLKLDNSNVVAVYSTSGRVLVKKSLPANLTGEDTITAWSLNSKKFLENAFDGTTSIITVYGSDGAEISSVLAQGEAHYFYFSPNGNRVAFLTYDDTSASFLLVWNLRSSGPIRLVRFEPPDYVDGFTWISNRSLFAYTPTAGPFTTAYEYQNFYKVDADSGRSRKVPVYSKTKIGETWPYLDQKGSILAIAKSRRLFADARKTNNELLVEIDPNSGLVNTIAHVIGLEGKRWRPLPQSGRQTLLRLVLWNGKSSNLLTRKVDPRSGSLGPITMWNGWDGLTADDRGEIFGVVNGIPRFLTALPYPPKSK
jgi:hypothetical protein